MENLKPKCQLIGVDGNVFAIIGAVNKTLEKAGLNDKAKEFSDKAMQQKSYDDVLRLCMGYVDVC